MTGTGWKNSLPMISAQLKKKVAVSPFWGLGLLPLDTALRAFPHVLVKVGRKERRCPVNASS